MDNLNAISGAVSAYDSATQDQSDGQQDGAAPGIGDVRSRRQSQSKTQAPDQSRSLNESVRDPDVSQLSPAEYKKAIQERDLFRSKIDELSSAFGQINKDKELIRQFWEHVDKNPEEIFKKRGKNFDEIAENHLREKLKFLEMTPEQREYEETKKKLSEYENKINKLTESQQQEQIKILSEQFSQKYQQEILSALQSAGMPQGDHGDIAAISDMMSMYVNNGVDVPADFVVGKVRERAMSRLQHFLPRLNEQQLVKFLGPKMVDKIARLAAAQVQTPQSMTQRLNRVQSQPRQENKTYRTIAELEEAWAKKAS